MNKILIGFVFCVFSGMAMAGVKINDCWVKAPIAGSDTTAAFMKFSNTSNKDISLVSISTDAAQMAHFHNMKEEDGIISMSMLHQLTIPAHKKVELNASGLHVMLMGLKEPLYSGDWITLEFELSDGSRIVREMEVKNAQQQAMGM